MFLENGQSLDFYKKCCTPRVKAKKDITFLKILLTKV